MSLTERTHVSAETVRTELAELEVSYKQRSKTLKALLRALEAEAGPIEPEKEAEETEEGKDKTYGEILDQGGPWDPEPAEENKNASRTRKKKKGVKADG